jgi:hypothetical protein
MAGTSVLSGNEGYWVKIGGKCSRPPTRPMAQTEQLRMGLEFSEPPNPIPRIFHSKSRGEVRQGGSARKERARSSRWAIRYEKRKGRPEPHERNDAPDRIAVVCDLDGELQR